MVGLPGEIGGCLIIYTIDLEPRITQVAPQNRRHAEFMCIGKSLRYLDNLTGTLRRPKVNGCANGYRTQVPGFFDGTEHNLVVLVRVSHQLIMVDLDNKWDAV